MWVGLEGGKERRRGEGNRGGRVRKVKDKRDGCVGRVRKTGSEGE